MCGINGLSCRIKVIVKVKKNIYISHFEWFIWLSRYDTYEVWMEYDSKVMDKDIAFWPMYIYWTQKKRYKVVYCIIL